MQLPGNIKKTGWILFLFNSFDFFMFPLLQGQCKGQAGGEGKEGSVFLHSLLDKMKAEIQESLWKLLLPKLPWLEQSLCRATSLSAPLSTLQ